ncbi:alpha/beta fold hydrolase [Sulfitobacter sp. F26169L]|uniref:alpha/beta fold hydrolase n=1 Tax=Sulfitobacter sp. F26169L TaxID=2996015 RepID=UPI002260F38B|nr:alpha/beta fold hydrolase [Sulfitobacter sp. F26169L]MCX7566560.1 alpha/beta fold hydrolase [Sulfitobacter sp. F26169L]
MPVFEHDGIAQHYERSGNGPPLLLIAGMMSDSASWISLLPLLEPHFTIIRPDNRTTGRTTPWDAPASVEIFAADCAALLAHLHLGPAHVMGHSLGGMIGWELANRHPENVKTLTLAASAPLRLERNVTLFKTLLAIRRSNAAPGVWLQALFPWLFAPAFFETTGAVAQATTASLAYPYAQTAQAMTHQIAALESYAPDSTQRPACPTQAILAQTDMILPADITLPVLGDIPIHMIENAGHSIHWDAPDTVAAHLHSFTALHEER